MERKINEGKEEARGVFWIVRRQHLYPQQAQDFNVPTLLLSSVKHSVSSCVRVGLTTSETSRRHIVGLTSRCRLL